MTDMDKRATFRALHVPGDPLVMPNPWDIGSAKVLAGLGAKALATTSSGHAFTIGKPDMGRVTAEEAFAHAAAMVAAATGRPRRELYQRALDLSANRTMDSEKPDDDNHT